MNLKALVAFAIWTSQTCTVKQPKESKERLVNWILKIGIFEVNRVTNSVRVSNGSA